MVKISLSASKVLIGFGLGAALCSSALAQSIDLWGDKTETYFDTIDGNYVLKEEYRNEDLNINLYASQNNLNIDMGSNKLNITAPTNSSLINNSSFSASEINLENIVLYNATNNTLNGNVTFNENSEGNINGIQLADNGSLTINGNVNSNSTMQLGFSDNSNFIDINGEANFGELVISYYTTYTTDSLLSKELVLIDASQGLNVDLSQITLLNSIYYKNIYYIESIGYNISAVFFTHYGLKLTNNQLILSPDSEFYFDSNNNKQILEEQLISLEYAKRMLESYQDFSAIISEAEKAQMQELANKFGEQATQISQILTQVGNGEITNAMLVELDTSISAENKLLVAKFLDGLENLKDAKSSMAIKFNKLGEQVANDIKSSAKSISNTNSASTGVNSSINVSNDLSITSRVAMLNNPYGSYASRLSKLKFASNDIYGQMLDDYKNSVWANVIGGANIIDGESGALYGATVGYDRRITDDVILGAYFTYANAEIKDKLVTQESDNFQIGAYSNIRLTPKVEVNVKAFAQFSPTDQDIINTGLNTTNSADFTRNFFGLSANVGYVFDFSDNTLFIKPFAGANYYYAHTPSYTESGTAGKDIKSASNNSLSLELGAEFRKYMSESSYLFITPKIEQYVVNNGDDYVATLGGVELPSVKSDDKKKTYAQVVLGGNLDLNERLSLNAGIGAKQILAGKVDNKNETYVSGQIGFKYKF